MPGFPRNAANLERVGEEEESCWTNGGPNGGLVVSFMGLMTEPGSQPESNSWHGRKLHTAPTEHWNTIKTFSQEMEANVHEFPLGIYLRRKGWNQLYFTWVQELQTSGKSDS